MVGKQTNLYLPYEIYLLQFNLEIWVPIYDIKVNPDKEKDLENELVIIPGCPTLTLQVCAGHPVLYH